MLVSWLYFKHLKLFTTTRCFTLYLLSVSFCIVLGGAVISKTTILFMTSQIRPHKKILHCNKDLERDKQYVAEISSPEQVAWIWCIATAFLIPELGKPSQTQIPRLKIGTLSIFLLFSRNPFPIFKDLHFQISKTMYLLRFFGRPTI